ncbi:SipW-dependent-type signal peptide-containing protein [Nocardioides litoris]|uniref:SipW-dependent-type signal peptide-containing protein n=1 Tax=Nocardioides litoris TaxID=1926648 RepID=UPI0014768515|nr:SipW-dependent-type signal peptide-containing protein [Nocardioides litoris]
MNKKLTRGALAGVAVVALAAGGGTFAAWSDFNSIDGNQIGADELVLKLEADGKPGAVAPVSKFTLAPGVLNSKQFVVSSRQGDTIPKAGLSVALADLVGTEDGCSGNSEVVVDNDCATLVGNPGEFLKEAELRFYSGAPTKAADPCETAKPTAKSEWFKLDAKPQAVLGDLAPGEKMCVMTEILLPKSATNASQGDSAAYNLDFTLDQKF